jgi:type IV pilus assembly protein PilE
MMQKQKGLTLVELMVVVAVMAVVASVAYPLYTNQVQKSRRADAKVALQMVAMEQERFYTLNGRYTANLSSLPGVPSALSGGNSQEGYYSVAVALNSGGQGFSATATAKSSGAQSGDATNCATFTLNNAGAKGKTGSASNCW